MEIHRAARKHGVRDADMRHAVANRLHVSELGDDDPPWRVLVLGPDRAGNLLELVVLEREHRPPLVIHAMSMRTKYQRLLDGVGWESDDG